MQVTWAKSNFYKLRLLKKTKSKFCLRPIYQGSIFFSSLELLLRWSKFSPTSLITRILIRSWGKTPAIRMVTEEVYSINAKNSSWFWPWVSQQPALFDPSGLLTKGQWWNLCGSYWSNGEWTKSVLFGETKPCVCKVQSKDLQEEYYNNSDNAVGEMPINARTITREVTLLFASNSCNSFSPLAGEKSAHVQFSTMEEIPSTIIVSDSLQVSFDDRLIIYMFPTVETPDNQQHDHMTPWAMIMRLDLWQMTTLWLALASQEEGDLSNQHKNSKIWNGICWEKNETVVEIAH